MKVSDTYLLEDEILDPEITERFRTMMAERERGTPTAYIIGEWDFFGRTFKVKEGVLIPRPETEVLVEKVLDLIPPEAPWEGLDLGTGTGCIAVTLLAERPRLRMTAVDLNPDAVHLTSENAEIHGVLDRLEVLEGDMFQPVKGRVFDFIVANPPYIPARLWDTLPPEVRKEGRTSLIGGERGYEFYTRLAEEVKNFLKPGGFVALEIGHDQGEVVKGILGKVGLKVNIYKDYAGKDRVILGWS